METGDDWWIQNAPRGGAATNDRIFLLSIEEVVRYFGDSGQLANGNPNNSWVMDDRYNSARIAYTAVASSWGARVGDSWWWWLRSPGQFYYRAAGVHSTGRVYVSGSNVCGDDGHFGGIRPALWLQL
jgi:hypothetical protein